MKRTVIGAMTLLVAGTIVMRVQAQVSNGQADRIRASADALADVRGEPDKDIPQDLWDRAHCVVVIPSLKKAAFVFGGEYGERMMGCRANGEFGAPVFMELEEGELGLSNWRRKSIDLVLLVMNPSGMKKMLGEQDDARRGCGQVAAESGGQERGGVDRRAKMNAEAALSSAPTCTGPIRGHRCLGRHYPTRR